LTLYAGLCTLDIEVRGIATNNIVKKDNEMKLHSYKQIEQAVETAADQLEGYYLDWLNNFLTTEGYARYYGITKDKALDRLDLGRKIHNQRNKG
jgi:hypothetical protein